MHIRRYFLFLVIAFTSIQFAFGQTEAMKDAVNNLAFFYKKNDLKFLGEAKKAVDNAFKTHADSVGIDKNVYKAIVYSSIVYLDSLNQLKQPDTLLLQTTKLVNRLQKSPKIERYNVEMNYAKGCLANVYLRKAFDFYSNNNYQPAIANFKIAQNYVPAAKQINNYLANIYYNTGNYNKAASYYDTLLNENNPHIAYIQSAVNLYKTLGDTVKSLQIINKGVEKYPNDKFLLFEQANIYNNKKDYQMLKNLLPKLIEVSPNDYRVLFMAANCYDHLNKTSMAESLYLKTIELDNSNYSPLLNLGLLYLKAAPEKNSLNQGYWDKAKNYLEKANEIDPNNEKCLRALQLLYLQTNNSNQLKQVKYKLQQLTN